MVERMDQASVKEVLEPVAILINHNLTEATTLISDPGGEDLIDSEGIHNRTENAPATRALSTSPLRFIPGL